MLWILGALVCTVALALVLAWNRGAHNPTPRPPLPCDSGQHVVSMIEFRPDGIRERCMACGHTETRVMDGRG